MQLKALEPLPHAEGNFDVKYDMKDGWKPMDPKERAALHVYLQNLEKQSAVKNSAAINMVHKNDQPEQNESRIGSS